MYDVIQGKNYLFYNIKYLKMHCYQVFFMKFDKYFAFSLFSQINVKHLTENWFNYLLKVNPLKMVSTSFKNHESILIHHLILIILSLIISEIH